MKDALRSELIAQLTEMLATARAAHAAAVEGATHSEAKAENDKDTRGLEQSYIARGQAARVAELEAALVELEKLALRACAAVAMSAVVTVEDDGEERTYFIAPHGGGNTLAGGVQVITPSSPLARALLGKRADDEVDVQLGGKARSLVVLRVV